MKKQGKKRFAKVIAPVLVASLAVAPSAGTLVAFAANGGQAIPVFNTQAEALEAARDLNTRLTGEGSVLLKNKQNALPVKKDVGITVFGAAANALQGGGSKVDNKDTEFSSVRLALVSGGFTKVNEKIITETDVVGTPAKGDTPAVDPIADTAVGTMKDVAVVVLKRGGGEGSDLPVATSELATDDESASHKRLAQNNQGKDVKHNQMLTENEKAMIAYAKKNCTKVVVILNTSNAMEMKTLEDDDEIDSILWIGRPGTTGLAAVPKLLSGAWNPSGKLVAEWYNDFTADPTWYNSMANTQNDAGSNTYILEDGSRASNITMHGVDYSEDIYMGYKYYETVYADIAAGKYSYNATTKELTKGTPSDATAEAEAWHNDNVVYPFGYGLSYTNFEMKIVGTSTDSLTAEEISSSVGRPAKVKTFNITVEVTNKGSKAGKEVVEIYSSAPYTEGGIEKAHVNLVAYAKTDNLKPGATQRLTLTVNLQDMASYDYNDANGNGFKGYELEAGKYTIYASNTSHCTKDTESVELNIGEAQGVSTQKGKTGGRLALDDFSDNEIMNLFSKENGRNYSLRKNDADWNGDGKVDEKDKMFTKEQRLLSRSDLVGTFPEAPVSTIDGVPVSSIQAFDETKAYAVGDTVRVTTVTTGVTGTSSTKFYKFTSAHAAGAFNENEVTELSGNYIGGLVVTEAFADLMDYYAGYTLNTWVPVTAYYDPSVAVEANGKVGITGTKEIYQAAAKIDAVTEVTTGSLHAKDDYVRIGTQIYKLKEALPAPTIIDQTAARTDGKADRDYAVGEIVRYCSQGWGGVSTNTVVVTKEIKKEDSFSSRGGSANCASFTASTRITDSNSEKVNHVDYIKLKGATKTSEENSGDYKYSDKLFQGTEGINGYQGHEDGLYDVTEDMMHGWSQMADAAAQEAKIASGDWIWFNELNGVKYTDKEVITEGKFAGMTGEEVWTKFMNQWTWKDFATACWQGGNNGLPVDNLGIPAGGIQDSPTSFARTYSWCDNCSIASTYNVELGEEQGRVTASLGLFGNTGKINNQNNTRNDEWLNPAINFQRTPFSGRNNEYYAQDGYQAGQFAQAVVKGIQSQGVSSHLKHMFLNDQETDRNQGDLMAWVSEQAIREIYVKPFQMGIQEGGAEGAMSAFARIGAVPTPVSDNMCNLLVRKEWGAEGFMFHPDMYSPQANVAPEDLMLRTGHNHAPGGNNANSDGSAANNTYAGRWDAEYDNPLTGTKGGVYIGKDDEATGQKIYYSNNQWYIVRQSAMLMYSEYANNSHSLNGIILTDWKDMDVTINTMSTAVIDASFKDAEAKSKTHSYAITNGELPKGLAIDAKTGIISGIAEEPTEEAVEITITGTFDKWIKTDMVVTINVSEAVGPQGPQGPQGDKGETGAQGPQGPKGEDAVAPEGGCGSSVETTSAAVAAAVVLAGLGVAIAAKKRKSSAKSAK